VDGEESGFKEILRGKVVRTWWVNVGWAAEDRERVNGQV
jgi:hypothetical protein